MSTTDIRQAAARIFDGMSINKEKLARECVTMCDTVDRLSAALLREQQKSAALQRQLDIAHKAAEASKSELPEAFNEMFGSVFGGKKK